MSAAAPSLTPEALPAVTLPPGRTMPPQLGQRLERRVGARMLVLATPVTLPLRSLISTATISSSNVALRLRRRGALLRAQRERVLVGARDLVFVGDVLGRLRHRIDAVELLHQRIDEAPADRRVENLGRTLETPLAPCP